MAKRVATTIIPYQTPHGLTTRHCFECRKSYLQYWNKSNQKECLDCNKKISVSAKKCISCTWKQIWTEGKINPQKISIANKGKRNSIKTEFKKGIKPWNYGIGYDTSLVRKIRQLEIYSMWRQTVLNRDDFTCQICYQIGKELQVDHYPMSFASIIIENGILSLEQAEKCQLLWSTKNGRTLCIDCHKKTENWGRNYAN